MNLCPQPAGFSKNNPVASSGATPTLGGQSYTHAELLALLNTPPRCDATLILSKQLNAASLNLANGSDPASISTIVDRNSSLSGFTGKLPNNVNASSATGKAMTNDAGVPESYNDCLLTPGCVP